ncbi:MAG: glycerophosphodiester phosphodiesterase family protein [Devosia sp.]
MDDNSQRPRSADQVQAHRGASAVAPENTIAAFRAAKEQGARWVELDVALLGDGTLVVMHDSTLDRTSSGYGSLADITQAELVRIDAGSWFDPRFAGEVIPTFEQTLAALGELELNVNVEIKQHAHHKSLAQLTDAVHKSLQDRNERTGIMISSFDDQALAAMARLDADYHLAMLWNEVPADWQAVLDAIPAKAVHLNYRNLTFSFLEATQNRDIAVRAWTCNVPEKLAPFWAEGLAGVITDNPKLYLN